LNPDGSDMIDPNRFLVATDKEVKQGLTTDVYFTYTREILEALNADSGVVMEFFARSIPDGNWGVVTGTYEVAKLLEGRNLDVRAMEEGTVFLASKDSAVSEPVIQVEGKYTEFAELENPILGFICSMSGISTRAARLRLAAGDRTILSFGSRRVHPSIAPSVEWASFVGGANAVSNVLGARFLGERPVGTMPHSLVLILGDQREAWKAFDHVMDRRIPRIALIDTLFDEKIEALMAADTLGEKLHGVRIDTPGSRRGNLRKIVEEVRWELNMRGHKEIKIIVSGGLDEESIRWLNDVVDGYGIGTNLSDAPSVDFSGKIVEIITREGRRIARAKRGDVSGKKQVYRGWERSEDLVQPDRSPAPDGYEPLLKDLIKGGELVRHPLSPQELRDRTIKQISMIESAQPIIKWRIP